MENKDIKHSSIGASSMSRWAACPGSVKLSEGIPAKTSVFAEEGTQAHELAEKILRAHFWPSNYPKVPVEKSEMYDAVKKYTDFCIKLHNACFDPLVKVEFKVSISSISDELFGTADNVIYDHGPRTLYVTDYKHGQGIAVDVKDNKQLQYYALGALETLKCPCEKIVLTIVQPRAYHADGPIRSVDIDMLDLLDFHAELKAAVLETKKKNAKLQEGDHCRFCPASPKCPKLYTEAQALAKLEFKPGLSYDPEQLSKALQFVSVLEPWAKNVREFAYAEALKGNIPKGFKLVEKRSTRKWIDKKRVIKKLKSLNLSDEEIFEPKKLASVAKIEKCFASKTVFNKKLGSLVEKPMGGTVLAPESDSRKSFIQLAKNDFEAIE